MTIKFLTQCLPGPRCFGFLIEKLGEWADNSDYCRRWGYISGKCMGHFTAMVGLQIIRICSPFICTRMERADRSGNHASHTRIWLAKFILWGGSILKICMTDISFLFTKVVAFLTANNLWHLFKCKAGLFIFNVAWIHPLPPINLVQIHDWWN